MITVDEITDETRTQARAPGPIILCAATRWETAPLAKRLRLSRRTPALFAAQTGKNPVLLLKTGMGRENAARALDSMPADETFSCALSTGFAGSINAEAAPGTVVADIPHQFPSWKDAAVAAARQTGSGILFGAITDSPRAVATPVQKKALGETTRALAVDMETGAIRGWAQNRGVPVLAVRVILDGINDELPAQTPAGEDWASLIKFAVANAGQIGRLLALGARQRRVMGVLTSFLENFLPRL